MKSATTEEYFQQLDSPQRDIALSLRDIIQSMPQGFEEQLKWNVPTYSLNKNICSIMSHKLHVNLQIMQGALLEDADQLEGTGKGMRHMKLRQLDELKPSMVEKLLQQAIKLDE